MYNNTRIALIFDESSFMFIQQIDCQKPKNRSMDNNLSINNFSPFNIPQIISDTSETNKSKTFLTCGNPQKRKEEEKKKRNKTKGEKKEETKIS